MTILCENGGVEGLCAEWERITAAEIRTVMDHPDASPRYGELATARHIAASMGWTTTLSRPIYDLCPRHSGRRRTAKRLKP